jgi:hypothetical protein
VPGLGLAEVAWSFELHRLLVVGMNLYR